MINISNSKIHIWFEFHLPILIYRTKLIIAYLHLIVILKIVFEVFSGYQFRQADKCAIYDEVLFLLQFYDEWNDFLYNWLIIICNYFSHLSALCDKNFNRSHTSIILVLSIVINCSKKLKTGYSTVRWLFVWQKMRFQMLYIYNSRKNAETHGNLIT